MSSTRLAFYDQRRKSAPVSTIATLLADPLSLGQAAAERGDAVVLTLGSDVPTELVVWAAGARPVDAVSLLQECSADQPMPAGAKLPGCWAAPSIL
jgi:hypothetical protein